jgi:hypothetical protein
VKVSLVCLLTLAALAASARAEFTLSPAEAKKQMTTRASIVRGALARRDLKTLARLVHPIKGLRFPNGCMRGGALGPGPKFSISQVPGLLQSSKKYDWGTDGESDEPVVLTFKGRYEHLWNKRFKDPSEVNYNTLKSRPLNYIKDLDRAFPGAVCVEFYSKGTEKFGGMNWSSLWLVFEPYGDGWRLTAILNDYQGV